MSPSKFRIAVVNSHPIQYFAPLYAYLSASEDIDVTALYLSDFSVRGGVRDDGFRQAVKWDLDLLSGYEHQFVREAGRINLPSNFFSLLGLDLWRLIRAGRFDALWLHGHNYAAYHVALLAAKSIGLPVFMRCETHLGLTRSTMKSALRRPFVGGLYKFLDGFLAIGQLNKEFYLSMGVPQEKISIVPYTVDNDRITKTANLLAEERPRVRANLGLSGDRPALLYASKFQRRKNPDDLLRAAEKLAANGLEFDLVLVGSGEMESELKSMAAASGLRTVFPGFVNQQELPRVMAACDIFVLPSENEPWGLIVNEAMCAGLPVVVSNEVGCVPDLLRNGENGATFRARDVDGLAAALQPLIADAGRRARMAARSSEIIKDWSYRQCLEGLRKQVDRLAPGRRIRGAS